MKETLPTPTVRRVYVSFDLFTDNIEAAWSDIVDRVVVKVGGDVRIHLDADEAIRLANALTDAVDVGETLPPGERPVNDLTDCTACRTNQCEQCQRPDERGRETASGVMWPTCCCGRRFRTAGKSKGDILAAENGGSVQLGTSPLAEPAPDGQSDYEHGHDDGFREGCRMAVDRLDAYELGTLTARIVARRRELGIEAAEDTGSNLERVLAESPETTQLLDKANQLIAADIDSGLIRRNVRAYARDAQQTLAQLLAAVQS